MKFEFKNHTNGFTIIELLIFITINGLLASVALPRFLSQAQKANQAEAKMFVGTMNRAQQAYYLERNNVFADYAHFKELGIGNIVYTKNYTYEIEGGGTGASIVTNQATPVSANSPLKAYIGGVFAKIQAESNSVVMQSILCEADKARAYGGIIALGIVRAQPDKSLLCPIGSSPIK